MKTEEKKYTMTDDTIVIDGVKLSRIQALRDFGNVKAGELGGYISCEENLSHYDTCWVSDDAIVRDSAIVRDRSLGSGEAIVRELAIVMDDAIVRGSAKRGARKARTRIRTQSAGIEESRGKRVDQPWHASSNEVQT